MATSTEYRELVNYLPVMRSIAINLAKNDYADLVQDACERAITYWNNFEDTGPRSRERWLARITKNLFLQQRRDGWQPRHFVDDSEIALQSFIDCINVEAYLIARSELRACQEVLTEFPLADRIVIYAVLVEGLEYQEVASMCGRSEGTIKSIISRRRRALQEHNAGRNA
jgi:RNA polymerase sigma-70 factor (ECF subfamily)